jgi:hypothetical protein
MRLEVLTAMKTYIMEFCITAIYSSVDVSEEPTPSIFREEHAVSVVVQMLVLQRLMTPKNINLSKYIHTLFLWTASVV